VIEIEQIKLFRFLFNGREDAFAIRWVNGNKSDYMPSLEIPRSRTSFFRHKVTTFTCLQSVDYDYCKTTKKSGHHVRNLHYQPGAIKANWAVIDVLTTFGNKRGLTAAQVSLAWLLAQKSWIVPIPGTTKLAHLQENLWSAEIDFTADELKKLTDDISRIKITGDRYPTPQTK